MTPVKVHVPLPASTSAGEVSKLLIAAGLVGHSEVDWLADCPEGDGKPILLVFVSSDAAVPDDLESAVRLFASQCGRVIAVWPLGGGVGVLPAAIDDYGAGSSTWKAETLRTAICGPAAEWVDATGGARASRPMDRNKNC